MTVVRGLSSLLIAMFAFACGPGGAVVTTPDGGGGQDDSGPTARDAHAPADTGKPAPTGFESVAIQPKTATLTVKEGQNPTQDFDVIGTRADGSTTQLDGSYGFEIDNRSIGEIGPNQGQFEASGIAGGQTTITATHNTDESVQPVEATVTVNLERLIEGPNLPSNYADKFKSPTTDASSAADVVYPLDGAVMPQNVYPPDIQWTRGSQGDLFKLTLTKKNLQISAYLKHSGSGFGNHWLVDEKAWRAVTRTNPDEPTKIDVTRYDAAQQKAVAPAKSPAIRIAKGSLTGSVYYWDISATRIKRIDDGTGKAVSFMPDPPNSANDGANCVGCHTISNNGRYMVGRLGPGNNIGGVFDLTKNLKQKPVPSEFPIEDDGTKWWFSTWNPDDTRLMVTQGPGNKQGLSLMDPFTGKIVQPKGGSLPKSGATQPAWAPDDSLIAYVSGGTNWGGELDKGNISTMPVTGQDSFGSPQKIVDASQVSGAPSGGDACSYPTWSPDSKYLAFAYGTGARSVDDKSAIFLAKRDGSGVVRLDNANGGAQTDNNFQPNFSPFEAGGYYWLSYLSKRPYGNSQVGTQGNTHQQIWVSAIDKDASGGDPSEVGFWLPGQSTQAKNISAFWAPRACREDGESCSVGSECCSGECVENDQGNLTCSPPPPEECREIGETCNSGSDCCDPRLTRCVSNVCAYQGG